MGKIKKAVRERVFNKYDRHCAYCGKVIAYRDMQVDHLIPIRQAEDGTADWDDVENENNYMPSCRRCNHYKRGNSLEVFRQMIKEIPYKLYRDNYIFEVGRDFGIICADFDAEIQFYFEKVKGDTEMDDITEGYEEAISRLQDAANIIEEVLEDLNSLDTPNDTI